jgi:hypothetical protein
MPLPEIRRLMVAGTADDRLGVLLTHRSRLVERSRAAERMVDALDTFIKETFMADINEDLRHELIEMFSEHQVVAQKLFEQTRGGRPDRFLFELPPADRPPLYDQAAALAHRHAGRLDEIVDQPGWPGTRSVGDVGEAAAWGIAQHADDDNDLCKKWLPLLEQAVREGDAAGLHFALLTDRVLLRDHQPQRFGTILEPAGSTWRPRDPLEAPDSLDDRRVTVGLEPFAVWAASLQSPDTWYQATTAN